MESRQVTVIRRYYERLSPEERHSHAQLLRGIVPPYLNIPQRREEKETYLSQRKAMNDDEILEEDLQTFEDRCRQTDSLLKTLKEARERTRENPSSQRYAKD